MNNSLSCIQGIVYSETAAANYGDNPVFEIGMDIVPACRLGTPEEVKILLKFLYS